MSPPPGEQNGEAAGGDPHRSIPTPFLTKTYQLVDDQTIDGVISWNDEGSAFVVWNPTVFARDLLPKYFKHNNFSSFVRQLNTYGFRKVVPDRWEFANDFFRKGEKKLLLDIQRRKISTASAAQLSPVIGPAAAVPALKPIVSSPNSGDEQVVSTNSSSPLVLSQVAGGLSTELIDENDRLRKENVQLTKEISEMKHLCNNIYSLVSNFQCNQSDNCLRPMDLVPMKQFSGEEEAEAARLFGVAVGMKRGREGGGVGTQLPLQLACGTAVKVEPDDCQNMDVDGDDGHDLSLKMATHR